VTPPTALGLCAADLARVDVISRLERAGAVGDLVALLSEPSWAARRAVIASLARLAAAVDPLCAVLLGDRGDETRLAAAVEALASSSGDADAAVLRLLGEAKTSAVLCDAAQVLGRRRSVVAVARLAQLAVADDDNVAAAAIEALGRIGGAGTVEPLIAAVASGAFFRVFPALAPLGRAADPRATPCLVGLLGEPRYATEAADALGRSGQLTAVPALVERLVSTDGALVRAAAGALTRLRSHHEVRFDEALRAATSPAALVVAIRRRLRSCVKGGRAADELALTTVLGWLQDDTAIGELVALLLAEGGDLGAVVSALGAVGARAEPRLLQALRDGGSEQRLRCMAVLKPTRAGLASFLGCLDDPEPRVRAHACRALARIGDVTAVPALFGLIGDANAFVSQAAVASVQALGCHETRALAMDAARAVEPRRRRAGLRVVAYFGYPEGLDVLLTAMSDPDERIRDAAIYGLPYIEAPRALAVLLEAAESPAPRTRAAAMRALGQSKGPVVVPAALRRGVRDSDAWVRYYACQSLGRLAVCDALGDVSRLIDDPAGQVRVAAIEAVAKLGDGQATAILDHACRSGDPDIRRAAILGLGACKRSEALPILLREVRSEDSATRLFALSALAESDAEEATEALERASSDPVTIVNRSALALLSARAGAKASRWLIGRLDDARDQDAVLLALQSPVAGRIAALLEALEGAGSPLARLLISALVGMGSPAGDEALAVTLAFANVHARRAAALALTASGSAVARGLLDRARLGDPDDEVRGICAAALR
jgi:HEAT repeat protein